MSSIRIANMRLVVYPNDHPPPHVHACGCDWELKISLSNPPCIISVLGRPKRQEVGVALLAVSERLSMLMAMWRNLHD